jgi:hypothetical protein
MLMAMEGHAVNCQLLMITIQGPAHDQSLPKIKSLSEIMGSYKTTASKQIHLAGYREFALQRSFHDHIIRDQKSFEKISN